MEREEVPVEVVKHIFLQCEFDEFVFCCYLRMFDRLSRNVFDLGVYFGLNSYVFLFILSNPSPHLARSSYDRRLAEIGPRIQRFFDDVGFIFISLS